MREISLGELSNLKLFDILKTLLVEKKTGVLVIKGKEPGEVYLEAGNIVHAKRTIHQGKKLFYPSWRGGLERPVSNRM